MPQICFYQVFNSLFKPWKLCFYTEISAYPSVWSSSNYGWKHANKFEYNQVLHIWNWKMSAQSKAQVVAPNRRHPFKEEEPKRKKNRRNTGSGRFPSYDWRSKHNPGSVCSLSRYAKWFFIYMSKKRNEGRCWRLFFFISKDAFFLSIFFLLLLPPHTNRNPTGVVGLSALTWHVQFYRDRRFTQSPSSLLIVCLLYLFFFGRGGWAVLFCLFFFTFVKRPPFHRYCQWALHQTIIGHLWNFNIRSIFCVFSHFFFTLMKLHRLSFFKWSILSPRCFMKRPVPVLWLHPLTVNDGSNSTAVHPALAPIIQPACKDVNRRIIWLRRPSCWERAPILPVMQQRTVVTIRSVSNAPPPHHEHEGHAAD